MSNHAAQTTNILKVIAGSAFLLSVFVPHPAMAEPGETDPGFSNASLQGTYVYVNTNSDVASVGPITFDGNGGVNATLEISLPCADPAPNCPRNVVQATGSGTYSVNPDGTGLATLDLSTGEISYSFIIAESTTLADHAVATKVSALGRTGGLAGQVVAPTWSR